MSRWRSQEPFQAGALFSQRLALDGIGEDEFLRLLGEPDEHVQSRFPTPPSWLVELHSSFSALPSSKPWRRPQSTDAKGAFIEAVEPLIGRARDRLRDAIAALVESRSEIPFDPETIVDVLYDNLPGQLLLRLTKTFVLELNVARLEGVLQGATPEERFQSFVDRLRQPGVALAVLEEYPVLARQLVTCIDQWATFSLEFLRQLITDWDTLRIIFKIETNPGDLVEVNAAGDRHREGRSVLLLKFKSGLRLVYKPRSLAIDTHFQNLLEWLNQRGDHPPFRTLRVLDRGSHGWIEFVHFETCVSSDQVHRFYERIGGYLALLHTLEATDFHCENLVAAGEDPMLLDLETMFAPRTQTERTHAEADLVAADLIQGSVLRVMLLPLRLWKGGHSEGIDIGGLSNTANQLTPFGVPQWEAADTDEMRLIRKRMPMSATTNTVTLNGHSVSLADYVDTIVDGFKRVYQLLETHRADLISNHGPLGAFAGDTVRVVLRPTQTYGTLLTESYHPDTLRNALDRDRLFDRLWIDIGRLPHLRGVVAHEREDLHRGDVPLFTTRPDSCDLWSSADPPIRHVLLESGMSMVRGRVRRLGEGDLEQQLWFIRASCATADDVADRSPEAAHDPGQRSAVDRERLLTAARAVGDRLATLAISGKEDVTWIGLDYMSEGNAAMMPLGNDLYDGIPGVALFLAYLGAITGEDRFTELAQRATTSLRRGIRDDRSGNRPVLTIGAFSGWGGLIYTLTHLSSLWAEPALLDDAQAIVDRLPGLADRDEALDIIGGAAGCIAALLVLHRAAPSDRILAAAIRCGDRLQDRIDPNEPSKLLTGFSHGAAGIAWALLKLASVANEERFRRTALDLIEWERNRFDPDKKNWPDLRGRLSPGVGIDDAPVPFRLAWCHGAPGIGLARLKSLPFLADSEVRREIDTALETTLTQGFGRNHCLCHGDMGNLELMVCAGQWLDPRWEVEANRVASSILDRGQLNGWLCGVPLNVEVPGLMTGIAGIGYELLRLADRGRVPSVLALEEPRDRT